MDIEEMGFMLALACDKIRANNSALKNDAAALREKMNLQVADMEEQLADKVDNMQEQLEKQLEQVRKALKIQNADFWNEFSPQTDELKNIQAAVDRLDEEIREDLNGLKTTLEEDLEEMKEQLKSAMDSVEEETEIKLEDLMQRSETELDTALDNIIPSVKGSGVGSVNVKKLLEDKEK